jgi:hypothetical protein
MNYFDIEILPILTLSEHRATCTIITIDGMKLLFDCGWDENFSESIAKIYKE